MDELGLYVPRFNREDLITTLEWWMKNGDKVGSPVPSECYVDLQLDTLFVTKHSLNYSLCCFHSLVCAFILLKKPFQLSMYENDTWICVTHSTNIIV